jgi:ferredoxin-NADP reductase/DMSO/TMAO reductase YedYZ heme-binding membrane subunit
VSTDTTSAVRKQAVSRSRAATPGAALRAERQLNLWATIFGLGLGGVLALSLGGESVRALGAPGGVNLLVGRVAGFLAAYLMLVMVVLMARIPALERAAGQDRLARWHRRIGGWPIVLIAAHGVFITFGYAATAHAGFFRQLWILIRSYPDVLSATVAFGLLLLVGVVSIRQIRRRVAYETWWATHLYVYLALGLAFAHEIRTGAAFIGHPFTQVLWEAAWAGAAASVLVFRVGLPVFRSAYHRLRVVEIRPETPGVYSVVLRGSHLERLRVEGGQYFQWRFLVPGLWWHAHPYSLSALPKPPYLRLTVRATGDHSGELVRLRHGTPVAIEGPYGRFTATRRATERVVLIAAGVGVTPIRAILEELPASVDTHVILRASGEGDLVLRDEVARLVEHRRGQLHEVLGPRDKVRVGARELRQLVPDIATRDVYVCGPGEFSKRIAAAARHLGVPPSRIHDEAFAFS